MGLIYQGIPWKELVLSFELKDKRHGPDSIFSPQGKLALMFLKSYTNFSDRKLLESVNGNIHYQMFCGIMLWVGESPKDFKIVSRIRTELGARLDLEDCQHVFAQAWKPYMNQTHVMLEDATCYETQMRYPTNVKLAADATYATNANRSYCTAKHITTNFKRKGRVGKYEDQRQVISRELNIERSTRMEGSFGTEKEHYSLQQIKARTEQNEVLRIFFGIHTANPARLAQRIKANDQKKAS